jgi:hypothetical protein
MAAGGNESGHMEQAGGDCVGIGSIFLVLFNPIIWIVLAIYRSTITGWDIIGLALVAVMGWWTAWAVWFVISTICNYARNYFIYRVKLYKWRKRKEHEKYMGIGSAPGTFH